MKLGKFTKSPSERKRYTIDYSDWLDTGELVSTISFSVSPSSTTTLQVDGYLIGTPATTVAFFANYGDNGTTYTVDVLMTTSGGQTKEDQILFSVRSP